MKNCLLLLQFFIDLGTFRHRKSVDRSSRYVVVTFVKIGTVKTSFMAGVNKILPHFLY
jgi:hypothetical protein